MYQIDRDRPERLDLLPIAPAVFPCNRPDRRLGGPGRSVGEMTHGEFGSEIFQNNTYI